MTTDTPELPAGWVDVSERDSVAPGYRRGGLHVFMHPADPCEREIGFIGARFIVERVTDGPDGMMFADGPPALETDDWAAVVALMDAQPRLVPVRWHFDEGPTRDGFTDGSHWNGWPNIWVTPATRDAIAAEVEAEEPGSFTAAELRDATPDADGLISLAGGYTPWIEEA